MAFFSRLFGRFSVAIAFLVGVLWGMFWGVRLGGLSCSSRHPWLEVVHSYLTLHWWRRYEAVQLTRWAESLGLPVSFADEREWAALSACSTALMTFLVSQVASSRGRHGRRLQSRALCA